MKLLAIDTATELCSAALWLEGASSVREQLSPRAHGELILPMIAELLSQAQMSLRELDAIAFGCGPGAFTGVRLAASIAQGLAFSAGLPVLPISDLQALAAQAFAQPEAPARMLVCQDARMREVYWGCFECIGQMATAVGAEAVSAPGAVTLPPHWSGASVGAAGSGFAVYPALLSELPAALWPVWHQLRPRAREIAQLAAHQGLAAALAPDQALPKYLRDNVATVPSPN